jgi:O-antigen/teichoic acid export membrane protein/O-antigen ligase
MSYKVVDSTQRRSSTWWNQRFTITKSSFFEGSKGQRMGLFLLLILALILVIFACTRSSSPLIAVVGTAALFFTIFALLSPSFALLLVFFGAGLPSIILPLSFHTMHLIEPTLGLCMVIIILRRPNLQLRLPHLLALLFLGIAIISFIHVPTISTDPTAYAADKGLYSVALFIVALFIGTFLADYIKNSSAFLVTILLSNIPLYLITLAQAVNIHSSILSLLEDSGAQNPVESLGRLWGPFIGAATFGSYLVCLLAVSLACWLLGTCRRDRVIGCVMALATALAIVGNGTRSAAIAAVAIVLIAFFMTRRFKLLFGITLCTGITILIFLGKILTKFTHDPASTTNRLFLWQLALQIIQAHPWIGIGLEQFPLYYTQVVISRSTQLNPDGISVHNQYLTWAISSGIIWGVIGTVLLFSMLYLCFKVYRGLPQDHQIVVLSAILAVTAVIIVSFVDVPLEKTEGAVFVFLLAGLAFGYIQRAERSYGSQQIDVFAQTSTSFMGRGRAGLGGIEQTLYHPQIAVRGHRNATVLPATPQIATDEVDAHESAPSVQKSGRTVIFQLLSWGISAIIIFPTTALLTRYLGPVQYGEYSFTIPFLSIFALLSGTGMDPFIIRKLNAEQRSKWSKTLSYAAGARLLSTIVVSLGAALVAFVLPVSTEQRILLVLGSGCLLFSFSFNGLRTVYENGYWAEQRIAIPSLIEAIDRVVTAGLIVVAIFLRLSLPWTYILLVYSDLPFTLLLALLAWRRFHISIRFSWSSIREYLFGSLPLTVHNALTLFTSQANLLLLLPLAGSLSVGIFALGLRITTPLQSVAVVYVIGLYPLLCKRFEEGRHQFSAVFIGTTRIMALAIIPFAIFVSMQAKNIVLLLGGIRFAAAGAVTQLLIWAVAATFFSQLAVRSSMAARQDRLIPYVTGISLAVNILANIFLIPHWQALGAAWAALLSQLVAFLLFTALLAPHVNLLKTAGVLLRVALGNIPALVFLVWQHQASLLLLAPIFVVLVIAGCVVTRTLFLEDIFMARQIFFEWKDKAQGGEEVGTEQLAGKVPTMYDYDITDEDTLLLPHFHV